MNKKEADRPADHEIDYEAITERFERNLVEKLRGHGVADEFLELWVPDSDPLRGIVGMIDSARIAGREHIAIRFRETTLPADRLDELRRELEPLGAVEIATDNGATRLRISGLREGKSAAREATPGAGSRGSTTPEAASAPKSTPEAPSESIDFHPFQRDLLAAAVKEVRHEGRASDKAGFERIEAKEEGIVLSLLIDPNTHMVREARHSGAADPARRAILETFCRIAEGTPIQEVADHVGLRTIDALTDSRKGRAVPGIVLPTNAHPFFRLPIRLARAARREYGVRVSYTDTENFYQSPPSKRWQNLSPQARRAEVTERLRRFLEEEGRSPDDMEIIGLGKNRTGYELRVVIDFSDRVKVADKPRLLRALERRLREQVEREIELIAEKAKDRSPLRRLS
jgi:hypothetical protein